MDNPNPVSSLAIQPYLVGGSLPRWEELPPERQQELIQALAALLMGQPQLQNLLEALHEPEQ